MRKVMIAGREFAVGADYDVEGDLHHRVMRRTLLGVMPDGRAKTMRSNGTVTYDGPDWFAERARPAGERLRRK